MTDVVKYITEFNNLKGRKVTKASLQEFLSRVKAVNQPGLKEVEKRLSLAITKVNGEPVTLNIKKQIAIPKSDVKTRTVRKREIVKLRPKREVKKAATEKKESPVVVRDHKEKPVGLYGITTADNRPKISRERITLPGDVGEFIGRIQPYKLTIVIPGEPHSSKSELAKQIADALITVGYDVLWIDWEQGGLESDDTQSSIDRNISPQNRSKFHVTGDVPKSLESLKELAKHYRCIAIDSGTVLRMRENTWIDHLRETCPDTIWILIMQQTTTGGTKGGSSAEFDSPVVLKTYRPDFSTHERNYAFCEKSRGNKTGKYYNIASKKIIKASAS
jgi:hypothetical protein